MPTTCSNFQIPTPSQSDEFDFAVADHIVFAELSQISDEIESHRVPLTRDALMDAESRLAVSLFGLIPAGHQREFFEYSKNLWIWHDAWTENGVAKGATIRYEVRPDGVFKHPVGGNYIKLTGVELSNFRRVAARYLALAREHIYK